jgi:hypothetical protein
VDKHKTKRVIGRPFPKGVSGNPGGRPKGFAALVREKTNDGQLLVDFMLRVLNGEEKGASVSDKVAAAKFLADRGFGKPTEFHEHSGSLSWASAVEEAGSIPLEEIRKHFGAAS